MSPIDEARHRLAHAEEHGTPLDVEIARRDLNRLLAGKQFKR